MNTMNKDKLIQAFELIQKAADIFDKENYTTTSMLLYNFINQSLEALTIEQQKVNFEDKLSKAEYDETLSKIFDIIKPEK